MTAQAERRPRPSSPDKKKEQDVSPDAVKARVMFFFAGISDLHTPIDRDYSVGRVTSVSEQLDYSVIRWTSEFRVNGTAATVVEEDLREGKVFDSISQLLGTDEDGSDISIRLEEHEGDKPRINISKTVRVRLDVDNLDAGEDAMSYETYFVIDSKERVRIARRLGVKV